MVPHYLALAIAAAIFGDGNCRWDDWRWQLARNVWRRQLALGCLLSALEIQKMAEEGVGRCDDLAKVMKGTGSSCIGQLSIQLMLRFLGSAQHAGRTF